ncbi:hypothetical protein SAMN05660830_00426 [Halodesulfovibrio aestuarii]|uniref:Uncharacterized protein n=1 Tax=Halodesulfovibrio aestuarii TaxID=126333 RepID=A0A8G2C7A2_9BACT|nr:hypothetical protein SAMN05660830_00426 [Halodesulfovibrio aestuarii]
MIWSGLKKCCEIAYWSWVAFSAIMMLRSYESPLSLFELAVGTLYTSLLLFATFCLFEEFRAMWER